MAKSALRKEQKLSVVSVFRVFTRDGYAVRWASSFDTRVEAEAWVSRVGEDGGWDEAVEVRQFDYDVCMSCEGRGYDVRDEDCGNCEGNGYLD